MFISNLKRDFYSKIAGERILMLVNYDLDAICASKILQTLFKYDHVLYSMIPIMGMAGLRRAFDEHKNGIKYVLLVNCGSCFDIVEELQPEDNVTFFVCDSHRPYDVCNIYSDRQVCILGDANLEQNIPAFESIFCEAYSEDEDKTEEEDEENDESDEQVANKQKSRAGRHERRLIKAHERRKWENERDRIMLDYTQYSYYGRSSALTIFELAWLLSKDNIDLLWWAIVGLTEQLVLGKIESSFYTLELEKIQSHVSRLIPKDSDKHMNATKITFEKDLHLVLYRHWNVIESMRYSWYCASKLKLWTSRGENKLHELLVEMGLPLLQAKQNFGSMDLLFKQEFYAMVERTAEKYGINNIVYGSFTLCYGYGNRYAAADYVYALLAILESIKKDKTPENVFVEVSDALSRNNKHILYVGIDNAKLFHSTLYKQVQSSLEAQEVHSTGTFFYYIIQEENTFFSYPYALLLLSRFLLHGHVAVTRKRQATEMPLIVSCLIDAELGLCLLLGVPPVNEDSCKNFFGKAFEQAALKSNVTILNDFFDSSIIQLRQADLTHFLDALTVLLS